MMLAVFRGLGVEIAQLSPADAHDAGRVGGLGVEPAQLKLMMLPVFRGLGVEIVQLMLMVLAGLRVGGLGEEPAQLMLMMLAGLGVLGKSQPS